MARARRPGPVIIWLRLTVGALAGALASAWLWPDTAREVNGLRLLLGWAALMVRVFDFHLDGVLLGCSAVLLALRSWRWGGAGLVLSLGWLATGWPSTAATPRGTNGPELKVMSVNLLYQNTQWQPTLNQVLSEQPDVILFQEYTPAWQHALHVALEADWPFIAERPLEGAFGIAIFSKEPFAGMPQLDLPIGDERLPQGRAEIDWAGRTVAVYCIHVPPPIALRYVAEQRRGMGDLLVLLARENGPVILSGDFNFTNDTPYAARLHSAGFRDAHELCGAGRGTTWPAAWHRLAFAGWMPGFRIDHIYLRGGLQARESRVLPDTGSDHRALVARLQFEDSKPVSSK